MKYFGRVVIIATATCLVAASASAQRPLQQVLDLNRQAMDHYTNLEVQEAIDKLEQAVRVARRGGVTGAPLARTYANLAVVQIGGMGDNAAGLQNFVNALEIDGDLQLDPLTSTPDIQTVFNLARQRVGAGGGGGGGRAGGGGGAGAGGGVGPGNIPHVPVPEQLAQTAVPVFIDVPDDAPVGTVYLYYKALGMPDFRRVEMQRMRGGYGFEIPCTDVFQPQVEYYIVAFSEDGQPLGFAGTQQQPIVVPIVATRTHPPPALPGRMPPETCGEAECPPGMPGCESGGGGAGLGGTCVTTADCAAGLTCEDNFCVMSDGDGDGDEGPGGDAPRFFLHIGVTVGFAYASSGMPADGAPPDGMEDNEDDAYIAGGEADCDLPEGDFCVRVETPGFVPTLALRATAGYYLTDRIGAAVTFRYQPSAGQGPFANMLLGVRGQFRLTRPVATGLDAAVFLGTSYGQIQPKPPQNGVEEPYIRAGLNGIQAGSVLGYRVANNFGFHATPELHILLPLFLFNFDITAGVEFAF